VSTTVEGTATETVVSSVVVKTAENMVTRNAAGMENKTVVSTKNGIKSMIDRNPMSECKEDGWTRRYL
jgi:hypothetical protein